MENLDNNQTASAMPSNGMTQTPTAPTQVPQAPAAPLNAGTPAPISSGGPQPDQQTDTPDPWASFNPQSPKGQDKDDPWAQFNPTPSPSNDNKDQPGVLHKVGTAAWEAAKDAGSQMIEPVAEIGDMAMHPSHINTLGKAAMMLLPFVPGAPEAKAGLEAAPEAESILPMTGGEKSQNAGLQRFERNSAAGLNKEGAEKIATDFRNERSTALEGQITKLGTVKDGNSPTEALSNVQQIIKDAHDTSKASVDALYTHAREVNAANPVSIPKDDLQENLLPQLKQISKDHFLDKGVSPQAKGVLDALTEHFNPTEAEGVPALDNPLQKEAQDFLDAKSGKSPEELNPPDPKLEDLLAWRRNAGAVAAKSSDPAVRSAIGKMKGAFDEYMNNLQAGTGSEGFDGIQAYKEANAARSAHGTQFEGNNLVEDLTSMGEKGSTKSIDDLAKNAFGSGAISGKQGMLDNYQSVMKAAGERAPEVQAHLQQGYAQKLFNGSADGKLAGGSETAISPKKMQTQFENMFVKQREFAKSLYGDEAVANADKVISELKQINSAQPYTTNSSGTATTAAQLQQTAQKLSKTISHMPYIGHIAWKLRLAGYGLSKVLNLGEASELEGQAATTFSGKVPPEFGGPKVAPKPSWLGISEARNKVIPYALRSGVAGASMNEDEEPNSPNSTNKQ